MLSSQKWTSRWPVRQPRLSQKLKQIQAVTLIVLLRHSGTRLYTIVVIPGPRQGGASRNDGHELVRPHLTPVPLQRWHLTTLSPFLTKPLPSQFLHFCFFLMLGPFSLAMLLLRSIERMIAIERHTQHLPTAKTT
jgi:hypothetical protein